MRSLDFKYWGKLNNEVLFTCHKCGALVPDQLTETHFNFHEEPDDDGAEYAISPTGVLHSVAGVRWTGGGGWVDVTECGVGMTDFWVIQDTLELCDYDRACTKCAPV